jgi:SAM-dependent methyltransferase
MKSAARRIRFFCPACIEPLHSDAECLRCSLCLSTYPYNSSGKLKFASLEAQSIQDRLDRAKNALKRFRRIYGFLISVVSPVYPTRDLRKFLNSRNLESEVVINLGSGSSNVDDQVVNFDIFEYDSVDVLCSIDSLPLADNSVDAILNLAVLEHVPNPPRVVSEFNRVLKPGGQAFCFVPFIQGFHASPWDFQRYTSSGLRELFKDFDIIKIKAVGPTSGLLWVFQEWLAIALSFGSKKLHLIIWLLVLVTTWPLKFLDFFFTRNKMAENIASGFVIIVKKAGKD